jgi:hypothetical protein
METTTVEPTVTEGTPQVEANQAEQQTPEPKAPENKENSYHELPEWARKRMGELAAAKNSAAEQLAALKAQIQQSQMQQTQHTETAPTHNIEELATQIANQRLQEQTFLNKMNEIEQKAKEEFGQDYDRSVQNLQLAGVGGNDFLHALAEVPNPEKVITFLGKSENVNEAIRISQLSPLQLGIELTKISGKAAKELSKQRSSAPAPVGEVSGGSSAPSSAGAEPPMSDTEAWIEWRRKTARKKR